MTGSSSGLPNDGVVTGPDILTTTFTSSKAFGRGYDAHEVDNFVSRCAAVVEDLRTQLRGQGEEITRLRDRIDRDSRSNEVQHAISVLSQAQKTADKAVAEADAYSARVMADARELYEEARRNAATLERETEDQARHIYEDALGRATTLEWQTKERITQLTLTAATAQEELDAQTAYLKTLRDATRAQVELFLEGLLNHVSEEFGRAHPMAAEAANAAPRRVGWKNPPSEPSNDAMVPGIPSQPSAMSNDNGESLHGVNRS